MPPFEKLIAVTAFDLNEEGVLIPTFKPENPLTEESAMLVADGLSADHAGVIAWCREVDLETGDYGPPRILFQSGRVIEVE